MDTKVSIDELLTRGVDTIYPSRAALETVLQSGKKLRLYQGFDPTGTQLHIGHTVALMKLRQFQNLGHHIIILIGDFTAMIGDPTGKIEGARKQLTHEEVLKNATTYKEQFSKIIPFDGPNPAELRYNSEWLGSMSAIEFMGIAHLLTFQQIIKREMFHQRMESGKDVMMNEFMYPVMQGIDSVKLDVDVELGGSDQMFNMLVGRDLMKRIMRKDKFVITVPLLTDSEGKKIGKTEGNVIGITDKPNDLFGKIMTLPDSTIAPCFELITSLSWEEVKQIQKKLSNNPNPMEYKKKLAYTLVASYNSGREAARAQKYFEQTFQERSAPTDVPVFKLSAKATTVIDILTKTGIAESNSAAKSLVSQGAIDIDGKTIDNVKQVIEPRNGMIIKRGKSTFVKIRVI